MTNIIYIAQFHETCGYTHAAHGYLKSIDSVLSSRKDINLKVISISLDLKKLDLNYHKNRTSKDILDLIDKYHFKDNEELSEFLKQDYICLWHMTSVLPQISKSVNFNKFYNYLDCDIERIIVGSDKNYHLLAWETDTLSQEYYHLINKYNPEKIIAPSEWNKNTYSKSFNSVCVPHLIESSSVSSQKVALPFDMDDKFVVFSVSEWTNRKNFQCLIRSFIMEFHDNDDAFLLLKIGLPHGMSKESFLKEFEYIKKTTRTYKQNKQNIVVIIDYINSKKMKFLYENCTIFALTSYGEGFSLPTSEAVILKKSVLCPREGGHVDYISKENRYAVEGYWDTVFDNPPYDADGNWYIPTIKSTREKLKLAYSDWKSKNGELEKSANNNFKIATGGKFSKLQIGESLLSTMVNYENHNLSKTKYLKKKLQNVSLEEQMNLLKSAYEGKDCFILNCGPSLGDYDPDKLKDFLKDKLVLSVKQAFNVYKDVTDFHFFNCSNLPIPENMWKPHYDHGDACISVSSSNYDQYRRWPKSQLSDIFFKIPIRTEINNEFLVRTGKIDGFLIKNNLTRPCGPGIMYETVLFMAIHLGVKSITCIGWDLTNKKVNESNYEHFYGSSKGLINRGDILDWEIEETRKFSKNFYEWCKNNSIDFKLASSRSALDESIPRIKLDL